MDIRGTGWTRTGNLSVGKCRNIFYQGGTGEGRGETGTNLDTVASACFTSVEGGVGEEGRGVGGL